MLEVNPCIFSNLLRAIKSDSSAFQIVIVSLSDYLFIDITDQSLCISLQFLAQACVNMKQSQR